MKRFLIQIFSFILLVVILWSIISAIVDSNLKKVEFDYFALNNYMKGDIHSNVLIMGNSRAKGDISPFIIDSILNVDSYNLGMAGINYPVQVALYQIYLKYNNAPDYIIQTVDNISLASGMHREEAFLPHLDEPIVSDLLLQYGNLRSIDYYLPFKYVYRPQAIVYGMMEFLGFHQKSTMYKGYEPQNKIWDGDFDRLKVKNTEGDVTHYDPALFGLFEDYVKEVLQKNTKIIFVFAPQYIEGQEYIKNRHEAVSFYQDLSQKYQILFLDYSQDSISYNKDYFYDTQHLNTKGAEAFSRKLANDLIDVIK
ncbi:MAG: hypothetical protein LBO74_17200 [Candidatus Symbiothrix sp.]|jgi:hypothetical protein|nr:hypothetical protein [Candidatus Symbiothrix sp.]